MGITILIATLLFLTTNFLFWKFTHTHFEKEYGKKVFQHWRTKTYYWQGAIFVSTGVTAVIIFLLQGADILTF
ncbi:hypothetical protein [Robertkochia aurantiaca]|uniref:hypothetical protein n=1 Tax=Robertkochia aurantiaca TaxID=2873700 RepID=UPI001CCA60CB|nr:hypothetical protein [Robertkochia sp. 3YJGBD-33]